MAGELRVVLEMGPKGRRVVAGAIDWPGLDRWGNSEGDALEKLASYVPRYTGVAKRAGLAHELDQSRDLAVIERYQGNSSTDFWGIAHVPSETEREVLPPAEMDRRLALLEACWAYFDDVGARVSEDLLLGPRGGGRDRDAIIRHTLASVRDWAPKVGVKVPQGALLTPEGLVRYRHEFVEAIGACNADGKVMAGRSWTIPFLVRRSGHHVMDHAWEMEDRDLSE